LTGQRSYEALYVVQVYAGYEQAAKLDIEKRIQAEGMQDYFGEILVPSANPTNVCNR